MIILGINAYHADSSAAIFRDGHLIAAAEEERFRRVKHWAGFPSEAIRFCLQEAGVSLRELSYIAIGRDPQAKQWNKVKYLLRHPLQAYGKLYNRWQNRCQVISLAREFQSVDPHADIRLLDAKLQYIEHHRSHMAAAFFASPFEEAAILSIDGSGDFSTTMWGIGQGNKIKVMGSIDFPHSIGLFYTAYTQYLGFLQYGDEYKLMGLASYGTPRYLDRLRKIIYPTGDGQFSWDDRYFRLNSRVIYYRDAQPKVDILYGAKMVHTFGPPRTQDAPLLQHHKDLAASVQKVTEELIFHLLRHLQKATGCKNICMTGGVAQNSVANGKVLEQTPFTQLYVPSAGHDGGISMGAALYLYNHLLDHQRAAPINSAYTGSCFTSDAIAKYLQQKGIPFSQLTDEELYETVVEQLIKPGVVGWFQGRAEFGPRALGARSILADPRNPNAKELLNLKIKKRESFRPFAPSILKEYVSEYFDRAEEAPFMEKVLPIKKDKQAIIPAVTHVDGTGRLQTVDKNIAPRYYQLIELFRKKTGIPILLNTSFNENEPIVNNPADALQCFLRTEMDMLVMENIVIIRK